MTYKPKVLVVGDWIWDQWYEAKAARISAEAPIPVYEVTQRVRFAGGAGNVTNNLKALGATVTTTSGDGQIIKNRMVVDGVQVCRWDENDRCEAINPGWVVELARTVDAVVVADYCKGSIGEDMRKAWLKVEVPIFVDTKRSPTQYPSWANFFPNSTEYTQYKSAYDNLYFVRKAGGDGMYGDKHSGAIHLPSWAHRVKSVCGAGDVVVAAYVYATLARIASPLAFANAAAACAVEREWTCVVEGVEEVMERMKQNGY